MGQCLVHPECGAQIRCYCQCPAASRGKFRGVSGLAELAYYYPLQKYKVVVETGYYHKKVEYYYPLTKYKVVVETGYYHKQVDLEPNLQREAFDNEAN